MISPVDSTAFSVLYMRASISFCFFFNYWDLLYSSSHVQLLWSVTCWPLELHVYLNNWLLCTCSVMLLWFVAISRCRRRTCVNWIVCKGCTVHLYEPKFMTASMGYNAVFCCAVTLMISSADGCMICCRKIGGVLVLSPVSSFGLFACV